MIAGSGDWSVKNKSRAHHRVLSFFIQSVSFSSLLNGFYSQTQTVFLDINNLNRKRGTGVSNS